MTIEDAIAALRAEADPERAAKDAAHHQTSCEVLGMRAARISELVIAWRAELTIPERVELAAALWESEIFEARVAATKLIVQARLNEDEAIWALILDWMPEVDCWALADDLADAASRRVVAHPERLDELQGWLKARHLWTKRAALAFTQPWAKMANPKEDDLVQRERILDWAGAFLSDKDWFIQKAVATWIRDLSKQDPEAAKAFLAEHANRMKPFALKEAQSQLKA